MNTIHPIPLVLALCLGGLAAQVPQGTSGASSGGFFSTASADADGGNAQSLSYALTASFGHGLASGVAGSTNFKVEGGFTSTVGASTLDPWLTAAAPSISTQLSGASVWLSGMRLTLGNNPVVTIGGKPATVLVKSPTTMAVQLPSMDAPGWHPITVQTSGGKSTLTRGIGILPLLYTSVASGSNRSFDLVLQGTKGDMVFWALGFQQGPAFPLAGMRHGLEMFGRIVVLGTFLLQDPSGVLRLPVPAIPHTFTIYSQALFVTQNPGYAPGSFSNVLKF